MAPPPRLSACDRDLLAFAAEHRFVLAGQVALRLDVAPAVAARRLTALRARGLLDSRRPLRFETTAFSMTRRGLDAIDGDLPAPPGLDLGEYAHDVGLAWLAAAAHRGRFGELRAVVGERRMRSEDRRADRAPGAATHGVTIGAGAAGAPRLHYPDLVLRTASGRRVAVELELSTKSRAHRERILRAYAGDRSVDGVLYLVPTAAAARAIERSATRVGARDLVRVQRFDWADRRPPGAAAAAPAAVSRTPAPMRAPDRDVGR